MPAARPRIASRWRWGVGDLGGWALPVGIWDIWPIPLPAVWPACTTWSRHPGIFPFLWQTQETHTASLQLRVWVSPQQWWLLYWLFLLLALNDISSCGYSLPFSRTFPQPDNSLLWGGRPVHCRMFSSIFGLNPQDTGSTRPLGYDDPNFTWYCLMSPVGEFSWLRITILQEGGKDESTRL